MPALTASQAAAIETRNAANLKAAKDGAVLKAAYYKPVILVGSTTDATAGHDKVTLTFLTANSAVKKMGTITIKKGSLTNPGSLTFGGGLVSPPAEAKTWLARITKKKLI
ncbi:MAG: hypothetical protein ABIQ99_11665 [Thermoflexales bacterium]